MKLRTIAIEGLRVVGMGILHTCMGLIKLAARLDGKPITAAPQPVPPYRHKHNPEEFCTTHGNQCSRCGTRGAVVSKYLPKPAHAGKKQGKAMARAIVDRGYTEPATMPITWRCCHCDELVCFNCTLVIPDSDPVQFYEDTYCSFECRDAHNPCKSCGQTLFCKMITIDNDVTERKDELWYCVNPNCHSVGLTDISREV